MCGSEHVTDKLIARDGCHIVECKDCSLWFTSPRINETIWMNYLRNVSDRSIEFTENRLKYGVALPANTKYSLPFWRKKRERHMNQMIGNLEKYFGAKIARLHDVGCGVGFLLDVARRRGIEASGNDLNGYACQVMKERLGLTVYNDILPNLNFEENSLDALVMHDYIEHTYHPLADFKAAHKFLKRNGIIYVVTFHINCREFDELRENWNYLFWNHVFHFSTQTLRNMIISAGFEIVSVYSSYENPIVKIYAKK
jgi:SAM-dependent methyltransferase